MQTKIKSNKVKVQDGDDSKRKMRVILWLLSLCGTVILMVVIGGVTRLTGSGLSIVEWKPLMGAIPPLTHEEWMEVFGKYQKSPQFLLVNKGMSLSSFQWIFFWEYFHRLLGRLMGVIFLIPWIYFWAKGYFNKKWAGRFLIGFSLGGLQGLMGWLMVSSGLVDRPEVSHLRLTAHLLLAFFILAYLWKLVCEFFKESFLEPRSTSIDLVVSANQLRGAKVFLNLILFLLLIQISYGALVAGLRAGYMFNTFPLMEGRWFPVGAWHFIPEWRNLIDNPILVQWIHRILGWSLLICSIISYFLFRKKLFPSLEKGFLVLVTFVSIQFLFGALTLLTRVVLPLAVIHQVGACLLLMFVLWLRWHPHWKSADSV